MTATPFIHYLSKSLFIRGLQCHKSLWLHKYCPEERDEPSDELEEIYQEGTDFGVLARELFPGGMEVPYEGLGYDEQVEMTRTEIVKGTATIYEATFCEGGIFVKADILHRNGTAWELYEVKSAWSLKDVHLMDAALQYHVLAGAGLEIASVFIVHRKPGGLSDADTDIRDQFSVNDITLQVLSVQSSIQPEIEAQRCMLDQSMPVIAPGEWCDNPYPCDFKQYCSNYRKQP